MVLFYFLATAVFSVVMYSLGVDAGRNRKYHVKYIENCSSMKLKTFHTRADAAKWVANFKLKYQGTRVEPDCWVDLVFQGDVVFEDSNKK